MQIFSTCGTSTWSSLMMVWSGSFARHAWTQSGVGRQTAPVDVGAWLTRMLPRVLMARLNGDGLLAGDVASFSMMMSVSPFVMSMMAVDGSAAAILSNSCGVGCADSFSVICPMHGVSKSVAFNVPGSAGSAGRDPSIDSSTISLFWSSSLTSVSTFTSFVTFTCSTVSSSSSSSTSGSGSSSVSIFLISSAVRCIRPLIFLLLKHLLIELMSDGMLAKAWNTCRLRMIV